MVAFGMAVQSVIAIPKAERNFGQGKFCGIDNEICFKH
jgi:hypothetical protein